ncbi:MAG: di-trans,poly-cis-decaprenylcistransferase [Oscillospiraceae bacterium]|nr:di-trans,poly-cis-decaprenylcistransferase [Oscillospiraceae bacterium]
MNQLNHVAIITDGNGRWATRQGKPRQEGHTAGRENFQHVCDWCLELGIRYLSFYVLSLDNLRRDKAELEHIQQMARDLCTGEGLARAKAKGIRLVLCGDRALQTPEDLALYENAEQKTADCDKLTIMFQTYYGGRDEIVKAARRCVEDGVEISEDSISARLYGAAHHTDPDLIIRTGGYQRLSGYLPWESVYSELYFTPTLFPDLSREEFFWACKWYEGIHRTHGGDREPTVAKNATVQKDAPFARKEAANG